MQISVKEIQEAITALSPEELSRFRRWFEEFDARRWDEEFERDARTGRLDRVAEEALRDYRAGNIREL